MSYWRLHYHLIWTTKQRLPLIGSEEEAVIAESLRMTMARMKMIGHAIGMVDDHAHLALSIPPTVAISEVVRRLKGASSHLVAQRLTSGDGFAWQSEYGVLSLTERALPTVVAYVQNQKQHHADNTLIHGLERTEQPKIR
jgi:putative transposase